MATHEREVPVLIIGGGIVGLSASLFLSQHGISSLLIERHKSTSIHPRSRSINARTAELYVGLGIIPRVREAGASMSATMGIHTTSADLETVLEAKKPRKEGPRNFPTAGVIERYSPNSGIFVTQDMLEPVLVDCARERGGELRFNTECLSVSQTSDSVTATLKDRDTGTITKVNPKYLIAADGANSPIRSSLDIPRTGKGNLGGHLLNILFNADLASKVYLREFSICTIERPEVTGVFTSIDNHEKWVFHLYYDEKKGQSASDFPPEKCKELVRLALGYPDIDINIVSAMPWEPSVRVATKMQAGRIFLAGDAAHQMPPWRGQGANSGIADVSNLAWKLAAMLDGHADAALLDTYEAERLPVGRYAAEFSGAAADERGIISTDRSLKNVVGLLGCIKYMSGHGYRYDSRVICKEDTSPLGGITWKPWSISSLVLGIDGSPGSRVPHLWVQWSGERITTLDLCVKGFVLLAGSEGTSWVQAAKEVRKSMGIDLVAHCLGPREELECAKGVFETAAGISSHGAILVRPDGFVVWRSRRKGSDPAAELEAAMRIALCLK